MNNDTIKQYKEAKEKLDALTLSLAQEEATYKAAKAQYDQMIETLKTKYNVSSIEEAKTLFATVSKNLDEKLKQAEQVLAVFSNQEISLDL